jgi:hypothetical protein
LRAVLLLLAACNHAPLPSGGSDLAQASVQDLAVADLALGCVASPVTISGTVMNATFEGRYGWAWYEAGDCTETPDLLIRSDDTPSRDPIAVEVRFMAHATTGDQMVMVTAWTSANAQPLQATGRANLSSAEPLMSTSLPTLAGTLTVNEMGIILDGSFSVRHCPMLDLYCV